MCARVRVCVRAVYKPVSCVLNPICSLSKSVLTVWPLNYARAAWTGNGSERLRRVCCIGHGKLEGRITYYWMFTELPYELVCFQRISYTQMTRWVFRIPGLAKWSLKIASDFCLCGKRWLQSFKEMILACSKSIMLLLPLYWPLIVSTGHNVIFY